jgi:hypothetical protein
LSYKQNPNSQPPFTRSALLCLESEVGLTPCTLLVEWTLEPEACERGRAGAECGVLGIRPGGNDTEKVVEILGIFKNQRAHKGVDLGRSRPPNYQNLSLPSACLDLVQGDWIETVIVMASAWTLAACWSLPEVSLANVRVVVEMTR